MRFVAPPISHHRLQRYHRWAMLWLTWFVTFLDAANAFEPISREVEKIAHRWLDKIERLIVCIIILRATSHMTPFSPRKGVSKHRLNQTALLRAFIGARIRRALRSKNLHQRIAALRQEIGGLVTRLLRRLPRGLTRGRPILARPEPRRVDAPSVFREAAACADTS